MEHDLSRGLRRDLLWSIYSGIGIEVMVIVEALFVDVYCSEIFEPARSRL